MPTTPNAPYLITFETLRRIATAFPGMEESPMFGDLVLKVRGKFVAGMARVPGMFCFKLHDNERRILLEAEPEKYMLTDHYRPVLKDGSTYVLAKLSALTEADVYDRLEQAYLLTASKQQIADYRNRVAKPV